MHASNLYLHNVNKYLSNRTIKIFSTVSKITFKISQKYYNSNIIFLPSPYAIISCNIGDLIKICNDTHFYKVDKKIFCKILNKPSLQYYFQENWLTTISPAIKYLDNVEKISIRWSSLFQLPKNIIKMKKLKQLYLIGNKFTRLPKFICSMNQLTIFDCSNNQLYRLPKSIGKMLSLQEFDCSNNQLSNLPESIGLLSNLLTLNCVNNQLNCLPESISELTKLYYFDCSHNQLTNIPESIGFLPCLMEFCCEFNKLKSIPESIQNSKRINFKYYGNWTLYITKYKYVVSILIVIIAILLILFCLLLIWCLK
jgi:hypothetical protein